MHNPEQYKHTIGWDVGGAHLKAALLDTNGKLLQVLQVPCALWRGLAELEIAIDTVLNSFKVKSARHAITMTGELVDIFVNREAGVNAISVLMNAKLHGVKQFYTGALQQDLSGFVPLSEVAQCWLTLASANWLASACYCAQQLRVMKNGDHALLIDIGSTTSDFVPLVNGKPDCLGYTDAARMQSEELVYTGVIRTPLMALTQKISFNREMTGVAAEYFSTTADVYRLTGDLLFSDDMADTADGQEKTILASSRRMARMIGHDVVDATMPTWLELAQAFKVQQLERLTLVAMRHVDRVATITKDRGITIIGAGVGCFLVKEIAEKMKFTYLDASDLFNSDAAKSQRRGASACLPAYAVACLLYRHQIKR